MQSGGSFDVDWVVTDPNDSIVIEGERGRQGDYIFTAQLVGEYSFCFRWVPSACTLGDATTHV